MTHVDFFKLQAKNLFRDYKTKTPYIDEVDGNTYYRYSPKYFDIDGILLDFDYDEKEFSLMKAQHVLALKIGFSKWSDLLKASPAELELAKLLFESKVDAEEWEMYIIGAERDNQTEFDPESRIEIFKQVFLDGGAIELYQDSHRL